MSEVTLENLPLKVKESVDKESHIAQFVYRVYDDADPRPYIWRKKGKDRVENSPEGPTNIILAPLETEYVTPDEANTEAPITTWISNPGAYAIEFLIEQIGELIADQEVFFGIRRLFNEAQQDSVSELSVEKLVAVSKKYSQDFGQIDTLIIHPSYIPKVILSKQLLAIRGSDSAEPNSFGLMGPFRVYSLRYLPEDTVILYPKRWVYSKQWAPEVDYDNQRVPSSLIVRRKCITWTASPESTIRVQIKL